VSDPNYANDHLGDRPTNSDADDAQVGMIERAGVETRASSMHEPVKSRTIDLDEGSHHAVAPAPAERRVAAPPGRATALEEGTTSAGGQH
jgi:hypothetical protein